MEVKVWVPQDYFNSKNAENTLKQIPGAIFRSNGFFLEAGGLRIESRMESYLNR